MASLRERIGNWALSAAVKTVKATINDRMSQDDLVKMIFGGQTSMPRAGSAALLNMYSTSPWLRAVAQRVSWAVAAVPWQIFVLSSGGKSVRRISLARCMDPQIRIKEYKALRRTDGLREIPDHPALTFLSTGNTRFVGQIARQVSQQHADLVGESLWIIDRNGFGLPAMFWPVPPTWVARRPLTDDPMDTYIFSGPGIMGSRTVLQRDVIRFYHPDPASPYLDASGIGHVLGDELETDEYAAKYTKRWFKNNAMPPMIVSMKDTRGDNLSRYEDNWMKKLVGRPNVPFFTNREIKVDQLNNTFQQMELTQLRKDERDAIIHVWGAPPEIFGIIENSNRSTIDAADYLFAKYVVVPRLEFQRVILQQRLVETYDERLILDYVSPVVDDKEFDLKVMEAMPYAFDVDEIRDLGGRGPDQTGAGAGRVVSMGQTWVPSLTELATLSSEPTPRERPAPAIEDPNANA